MLATFSPQPPTMAPFSSMAPGALFLDITGSIYLVMRPNAASPENAVNVNDGTQVTIAPTASYQVLTVTTPAALQ